MAKHTYTIAVNRILAAREPMEYKFRQTKCSLVCARDAAAVSFEMGTKKTHEDLITFRVDLAKDAMRKMYLLHAMRFDTRLKVRSVIVTVDGESQTYAQGYPGFPFLYSMLTAKKLALPESWQDAAFQKAVLHHTKTSVKHDLRFACLFSFLAGNGRQFEIERFTCYWTAVNALYNYLLFASRPYYAAEHGAATFEDLSKKKKDKLSGDTTGISALIRLLDCGQKLRSQGERTKQKRLYGPIGSHLCDFSKAELAALHSQLLAHRRDLSWVPDGPLGQHLAECLTETDLSAWGFLCLDYAYYVRCNYLHGSKTTPLFAAERDPELAAFRALNLFLGEFLKELIPLIFREDWYTEQLYQKAAPAQS